MTMNNKFNFKKLKHINDTYFIFLNDKNIFWQWYYSFIKTKYYQSHEIARLMTIDQIAKDYEDCAKLLFILDNNFLKLTEPWELSSDYKKLISKVTRYTWQNE